MSFVASDKEPLVTFPLYSIVRDLLGGQSDVVVSEMTAKCLYMVCKNRHTCYIQFPGDENRDIYGKPITECKLWSLEHWVSSAEKWQRAKAWSDKQRNERIVLDANIHKVARALLKLARINPDAARVIAIDVVVNKKMDAVRGLGVAKLYETVDEIK